MSIAILRSRRSVYEVVTPDNSLTPHLPETYTFLADGVFSSTSAPSGFTASAFDLASVAGPYNATSHSAEYSQGNSDAGGANPGRTVGVAFSDVGFTEAYCAFVFKKSANFQENASGTKVVYPFKNGGTGRDFMFLTVPYGGTTSGEYRFQLSTQPASTGDERNMRENMNGFNDSTPYVCQNDVWYRVEFQVIYNIPGEENGTYRLWLAEWNGTAWTNEYLVAEYTDVMFGGATTLGYWADWEWDNYMGGAGGTTLPADQFVYLNRVHLSVDGIVTNDLWPNEPSTYTRYNGTDFVFDSLTAPSGLNFSWIGSPVDSIVAEGPTHANSLRIGFPAGSTATQIAIIDAVLPNPKQPGLYQAMIFKLSDNWVQHINGVKIFYNFVSTTGEQARPFELRTRAVPQANISGGIFELETEHYTSDAINWGRNGNLYRQYYQNDEWIRLEMVCEFTGDPNGQTGIMKWWTSVFREGYWSAPVLNASYDNVRLGNGTSTGTWTLPQFNFYYGGSGGDPIPEDQYIFLNRVCLSAGV